MGREIRNVTKDWKHPESHPGNYIPLFDRTYEEAIAEWMDEKPSHPECYRPEYDGTADCFQMYETVSEGTPVSPVFETKGELAEWLVSQGYSEDAAAGFIASGWAPSFVMCRKGDEVKTYKNAEMYDMDCDKS